MTYFSWSFDHYFKPFTVFQCRVRVPHLETLPVLINFFGEVTYCSSKNKLKMF